MFTTWSRTPPASSQEDVPSATRAACQAFPPCLSLSRVPAGFSQLLRKSLAGRQLTKDPLTEPHGAVSGKTTFPASAPVTKASVPAVPRQHRATVFTKKQEQGQNTARAIRESSLASERQQGRSRGCFLSAEWPMHSSENSWGQEESGLNRTSPGLLDPGLRDGSPALFSQSSFQFALKLDSRVARLTAVCRHLPGRGGEERQVRDQHLGPKEQGDLGLLTACFHLAVGVTVPVTGKTERVRPASHQPAAQNKETTD